MSRGILNAVLLYLIDRSKNSVGDEKSMMTVQSVDRERQPTKPGSKSDMFVFPSSADIKNREHDRKRNRLTDSEDRLVGLRAVISEQRRQLKEANTRLANHVLEDVIGCFQKGLLSENLVVDTRSLLNLLGE